MADILLFGPHMSGKTQLCYSLQGKEYLEPRQTDQEDYRAKKSGFWGAIGVSKFSLHEVGGKDIYYLNVDFLEKVFQENEKLVFVFNGNEFIDELRDYQKGGFISTLLRCYVVPALEKCEKQKSIRFVATYADQYVGEKSDMASEIFACMERANEEYRSVANSKRYPFQTLLNGNLDCVDARDSQTVKELFKSIYKR